MSSMSKIFISLHFPISLIINVGIVYGKKLCTPFSLPSPSSSHHPMDLGKLDGIGEGNPDLFRGSAVCRAGDPVVVGDVRLASSPPSPSRHLFPLHR